MTKYRCIVADPPWPYGDAASDYSVMPTKVGNDGSVGKAVSISNHYAAMSVEAICALKPSANDDAHLYLWTTNSFMVEAHEICRAWGFEPKTILTWGKVKKNVGGDAEPSMKTGYWFRSATEHVVFGVRGSLRLQTTEQGYPTLFLWNRLPHSVKPDEFFHIVEECSPGPRLEMFARKSRLGWDRWGNEAPKESSPEPLRLF